MSRKVFRNDSPDEQESIKEIREAVHCTKTVLDGHETGNVDTKFNFWVYIKYNISRLFFGLFPNTNKWKEMRLLHDTIE